MGTSPSRGPLASIPYRAACAAALLVPSLVVFGLRDELLLPKCLLVASVACIGALAWAAGGAATLAVGLEAPLAAFCLAALASTAVSADLPASLYGAELEPLVSLTGLAAALGGFYLGVAAGRGDPRTSRVLGVCLVAGSAPAALLSVAQVLTPQPLPFLAAVESGRATGFFGHPVAVGAYLALVLPVAGAWALSARAGTERAAALSLAVLAAAGLVASGTRGAWLGAACGGGVLLWRDGRQYARGAALALVLVAVAAGAAFTARIQAEGTRPVGTRVPALVLAVRGFAERPVLGSGPGTFGQLYRRRRTEAHAALALVHSAYPHAHNDWAEVLAALGAAGVVAYAWLHAAGLRLAMAPGGAVGAGAGAGLLALVVFSKTNLPTLPVAFLAALLAGAALGARPPRGGRGTAAVAAALFLCGTLWTGWASVRRLPAERHAFLGRLARREGRPAEAAGHFEAAVRGVPESVVFRLDLMNMLWDAAGAAPLPERRLLLAGARDTALAGARLRPAEPEFLRLLALAELRRARWAGEDALPAASAALAAALALDPFDRRLGSLAAALSDPAGEALQSGGRVTRRRTPAKSR